MTRGILLLGLLVVSRTPAHAGTWAFIWGHWEFGNRPHNLQCSVAPFPGFCRSSIEIPPGTPYAQVTLSANDTCLSGESPHVFIAVAATNCSFDSFLQTNLQGVR